MRPAAIVALGMGAAVLLVLAVSGVWTAARGAPGGGNPYARWENGLPGDDGFFPIAVWLQQARNAAKYQQAGMNLYVGLWEGPTEAQLAELKQAGMPVICEQNAVGLAHKSDKTIVGWMHGDEPDNAQSLGPDKGYGPPILPQKIVGEYQQMRTADPTRPVMLNLGQGVAWDGWYGRGVRTNHPEDYPEYVQGGDIVSFDIYPVVHDRPEIAGNLWYVPKGVDRLRQWCGPQRIVWNCIECTRIANESVKPTPDQVRAEVWMALIHGSQGLIYFVHQFKPQFDEWALLDDPEMLAAVTKLNAGIRDLAPVLNSPTLADAATVTSSAPAVPVDVMVKRHDGATYVFAAAMRNGATGDCFIVSGLPEKATVEVIGEGRTLEAAGGRFEDAFPSYGVHQYKVR